MDLSTPDLNNVTRSWASTVTPATLGTGTRLSLSTRTRTQEMTLNAELRKSTETSGPSHKSRLFTRVTFMFKLWTDS
ncbi:hypothetical protein RRG08_033731 [Elysia crispata]|uniref:Uncharacterized protein n=1 Tax=Elysia crispata TaxID=231223 RepID=A0AAE1A902_9GAST|nr:hypothetical protein RRG08_033731 [Elysia crispata]